MPAGLTCRIPNAQPPAFLSGRPSSLAGIRQYSGAIGSRAVSAILRTTSAVVSGYYFYDTIEQPIQLRGRLTDGGITLTEFGDLREPSISTGVFELSPSSSPDALRGTWRSPDGKRTLRVGLKRTPPKVEHEILLTWERPFGSWQADVDYSPMRNELIYLEEPTVVAAFDLSGMRRRTLAKFEPDTRSYPLRQGGLVSAGPASVHHVVVSHTGDRVAFSAGSQNFADIYVLQVRDSTQTRLTNSMGDFLKERTYFYDYSHPKFSPDDRTLLFQILHGPQPNNRIAVIDASGGPMQVLGEGFAEGAYWSADGTRVCTYSHTAGKTVYEVPSGNATVGGIDSSTHDRERRCRSIADAASLETCDVPEANEVLDVDRRFRGSGRRVSERWVTPDVVINVYELSGAAGLGYRIQVVQLLH